MRSGILSKKRSLKTALLAAVSLTAAGAGSLAHAQISATPPPVTIEAPLVHAADDAEQAAAPVKVKNKWLIAAFATGAIAALMRLFGANRVMNAVAEAGPAIAKATGAAARAPMTAAKALGAAMGAPLKFALLFAGLGLVAFTGVGFYNIEWAGGLAIGAAMTGLAWYGAVKAKRAFSLRPEKVKATRSPKPPRS